MTYRDENSNLRVQIHADNHKLSARMREALAADIETLEKVVADFPVAQLHVHIHEHTRQRDFHVKANLRLPKRSLFTGERGEQLQPVCESCIRKLIAKTKQFKDKLSGRTKYTQGGGGTSRRLQPDVEPDLQSLEDAATKREFPPFREAMRVYDEALSRCALRHVARYPEARAHFGEDFLLSEIVDEVYLTAFERFLDRPKDRLGNWLEGLVDPSIRALIEDPATEKENIEHLKGLEAED